MRPRPMRCVSTIVSNAEVSFHVGFIQEVAGFGVELAFRGYLPQKTSSISRRSCETGRETRERRVCVVGCKKAVSYVIPTLILSFHTIEYFVPFLGTKLFHNILNYQSHNHAVLNPCRDGCLANTDQCSGQYLQYRPKCVYRYACDDNIITTGSIKTPVKN